MSQRFRLPAPSLGGRFVWRQLRAEPAVVLTVFVAALIGAFLLSAAPRTVEEVSREDLRFAVSETPPVRRNVRVERIGIIGAGTPEDAMSRVRATGDGFAESQFPESLKGIISDSYFVVDSPWFRVTPLPGVAPRHPFDTFMKFRFQEGIDDHTELVEGAMPQPQDSIPMLLGRDCPEDLNERDELFEYFAAGGRPLTSPEGEQLDCGIDNVRHFQVAVSEQTAVDMGLEIGEVSLLLPNDGRASGIGRPGRPPDRLFFGISASELDFELAMSISGIIAPSDIGEEYWYGDPDLHQPRIEENPDFRIISATGLISPQDYASLTGRLRPAPARLTWRHFVSADLVENADVNRLLDDLEIFELRFTALAGNPLDFHVVTQLADLLESHLNQRAQTLAMVSTGIAGLLAAVTAVVLVLAVLMTNRQRFSTVLARSRGASAPQLTQTRLYEALIMVLPAAGLGFLAAHLAFSDTETALPYRATLALAGAAIGAIVASILPLATRRLGAVLSESRIVRTSSPRRLIAELLVVVLAVGSVILLRRRGQIGETGIDGIDLLLAAAPALIAAAAGLIAIRIYPVLIQALAWLGSKARGLVGFVGFRRILQQKPGSRLPILAITICVATAGFSTVVRTSVDQGQEASSWQAVGGDFSIKGHSPDVNLHPTVDLESFEEFGDVAQGTTFPGARAEIGVTRIAIEATAIDSDAYLALTDQAPVESAPLQSLALEPQPGMGTEETPIPILVSSTWSTIAPVRVGDVIRLNLIRFRPHVEVVGVIDRFPDIDVERPFVILDLEAVREFSELAVPPTVAYLSASEASGPAIEERLTVQSRSSRLTSRYATLQELEDDPFVASVTLGMTIVFVFSVALAAVAALSSLALGSADRRRDFGYLRTMGLRSRHSTVMTVIEQFPSVVVATITGVLVGVGTAVALDPAIDFDTFSGDLVPTALEVDWISIGLGALAIIGVLSAAVVLFVTLYRGENLGRALRVGDE